VLPFGAHARSSSTRFAGGGVPRGIVVIPLPALGGGVPRGIVERGVPLYSAGWDREVRVALSAVAVADCDLVLLEIRSTVLCI
jgi:hypothetical protein